MVIVVAADVADMDTVVDIATAIKMDVEGANQDATCKLHVACRLANLECKEAIQLIILVNNNKDNNNGNKDNSRDNNNQHKGSKDGMLKITLAMAIHKDRTISSLLISLKTINQELPSNKADLVSKGMPKGNNLLKGKLSKGLDSNLKDALHVG
jgi:hypothetical protein